MQSRIRSPTVEAVSIGVKLSVGKSVAFPENALMSTGLKERSTEMELT